MPSSRVLEERAVLQKSKAKLFDLVCNNASKEQWAEWLRVPLEHATAAGDLVLVNDLLAAGTSWKAGWRGCHNRTLLCAAVQGGNVEVVEDLLNAGATTEVDVSENKKGRVPLHYAVDSDHEAIAELLLLSGASPDYRDGTGAFPIHTAVSRGHEGIVSLLLLRGGGKDVLNDEEDSPLHMAAEKGRASVARALLIAGADWSLRNEVDFSALDLAAMGGHLDVIRALVHHGADLRSRCSQDFTALHHAAYHDQPGAVDMLLKFGCSIEARTECLSTPLHLAAVRGSCGALVALLRHKANVHAKDDMERSPLIMACRMLQLEAADLLLRWGADETIADNEGSSALQLIGAGLKEDCGGRQPDVDSMHKLLANAPADRAWRRRGWLVLCRAFPQKAQFGQTSNQGRGDSTGEIGEVGSTTRATAHGKIQQVYPSVGHGDDSEETERATAASIGSTKRGRRIGFCSVETRVAQMEQGNLFRIIVSFL